MSLRDWALHGNLHAAYGRSSRSESHTGAIQKKVDVISPRTPGAAEPTSMGPDAIFVPFCRTKAVLSP